MGPSGGCGSDGDRLVVPRRHGQGRDRKGGDEEGGEGGEREHGGKVNEGRGEEAGSKNDQGTYQQEQSVSKPVQDPVD